MKELRLVPCVLKPVTLFSTPSESVAYLRGMKNRKRTNLFKKLGIIFPKRHVYPSGIMNRCGSAAVGILLLVALGVGGLATSAAARDWELDKAHSNFYFSVRHIFSKIHGHFNDFSSEIKFDPDNPESSSFTFAVKTASIDTNIAKRDKHLQSSDFFDAGKYPLITFQSTSVKSAGDNVYEVTGKFTVKGKEYDLVLPLTLAGVKLHPAVKGKEVIGFNGELTLDRLAYNIGNGKFAEMGIVGRDVDILVSIEALSSK